MNLSLMDKTQLLRPDHPFPDPFPKGGLLRIDKPLAWTSFDVVNKVRYLLRKRLNVKKLKVGHAGTLDPLATGLLLLCVGEHTKKIDQLLSTEKTYTGVITFGATTPSFDLEKPVAAVFPTEHLHDALLQSAKDTFLGDILQVPPIFSAVKVEGTRLYKNARTGETVELPQRPVHIAAFELGPLRPVAATRSEAVVARANRDTTIMLHPDHAAGLQADFRVVCSKGTYIRSLVHDLGQAVGSGAYLSSLRRTHSGDQDVADAWDMDALMAFIAAGA
jgi:tRNA pseudouridine55 synthase